MSIRSLFSSENSLMIEGRLAAFLRQGLLFHSLLFFLKEKELGVLAPNQPAFCRLLFTVLFLARQNEKPTANSSPGGIWRQVRALEWGSDGNTSPKGGCLKWRCKSLNVSSSLAELGGGKIQADEMGVQHLASTF